MKMEKLQYEAYPYLQVDSDDDRAANDDQDFKFPCLYDKEQADQILTGIQKWVEMFGMKTRYKNHTQEGIAKDAARACRQRWREGGPSVEDMLQGKIISIRRRISQKDQGEFDTFISVKCDKKLLQVSFICSPKGSPGNAISWHCYYIICMIASRLGFLEMHVDTSATEWLYEVLKVDFDMVVC